jgi:phosphoribosylanthranilate isomerase
MSVAAKICGLNDEAGIAAAIAGGAAFVGFVFYPPSPRHVTPKRAAALAALVPRGIEKVGLFVDADDDAVAAAVDGAALDMLQFHGGETPARVAGAKHRFGLPVMKAIKIASRADLAAAHDYFHVADRLLFDAKPPEGFTGALPGGNGLAFDWQLLGERQWSLPWMLSGGLNAENLREAVTTTHAKFVDVSSGVEGRPGLKDPAKITAFLDRARSL